MIRFKLEQNSERAVAAGYPVWYPVALTDDQYSDPLTAYSLKTGHFRQLAQ